MPITNLHVTNVGPFDDIHFEFDDQVNVFIGSNNSGKSSALFVLADIATFPFVFPEKLIRSDGEARFEAHFSDIVDANLEGTLPVYRSDASEGYWTEEKWAEYLSFMSALRFSKFVPALRLSTDYASRGPTAAEGENSNDDRHLLSPDLENLWRNHSALFRMSSFLRRNVQEEDLRKRLGLISGNATLVGDEQVIQTIVEWDYRAYLRGQTNFRSILTTIGEIAEEITDGFIHGFEGVREYDSGFSPEFLTRDGILPLNVLSQGTQSIIQWLSHLIIGYAGYYDFPDDLAEQSGVLIVDEIDAHLHPAWQRRIIPTLTSHFPNLQIFCSTHSPLMLAGLEEGQVQMLERDGDNHVTVSRNRKDIHGWTSDEILRNFLGVSDPTDLESTMRLVELEQLENMDFRSAEQTERLELLRRSVSRDLLKGPTVAAQLEEFRALLNALGEDSEPTGSPVSDQQGK